MQQGSGLEMLVILAVFGIIFYFMIYRPQAKRQKEQRELLSNLAKGDEILTSGGLIGRITKVSAESENVVMALNDNNNEVMISRNFVVAKLPKGTMKALKDQQ
ncbi:preprotein translocase subunit YajC [Actinobacillus minor NM305]|uniref:Sec translocon accessory complex subunit YajC n=1 Tax=Actinobacillus minor NM305 TaxID=637911 RepID=C5S2U7_9PAST|nr:preprotein translocase subunit YajC [Actinobacillus minor]EER46702.1 preprotein translocase subunit YajC [Actinobacillus minor NM305]MDY5106167.1 preprotein translocase subunit YajC [Actinobacillus minor]